MSYNLITNVSFTWNDQALFLQIFMATSSNYAQRLVY